MTHNVTILTVTRPESVEAMRWIYPSNAGKCLCGHGAALWWGGAKTTYSLHLCHDFIRKILAGVETICVGTIYADGVNAENRRTQLPFFWRFEAMAVDKLSTAVLQGNRVADKIGSSGGGLL